MYFSQRSYPYGNEVHCVLVRGALNLAYALNTRISHLGLEAWQQEVSGLIFCKVYQTLQDSQYPTEAEDRVLARLGTLEKLEAASILKLAVWKHECQMHPMSKSDEPFEYMLWFQVGWKEVKEAHKTQPSIDIIAERVHSFL